MILVIGYGNSDCGDDGAGPAVVARLAEQPVDGVEYRVVYQLTPELAEPVSRAEAVIFVDAAAGETPGRVVCREVGPEEGGSMTHHVAAGGVLALAGALYGATPRAALCTIGGENFELGEGFSAAVEAGLEELVEAVRGQIEEMGAG